MYDFIIIGGGIAGLSTGARLSELGKVILLETEQNLGHHASGRSAALFEQSYGKPATIALNRASAEWFFDSGLLSDRGLMLLGKEGNEDAFNADRDQMGLTDLGMDKAQHVLPIIDRKTVTHAAFHAEAWDIDTDKLLQTHAKTIRANGGEIRTGTQVTDIHRTTHGWQISTADDSVTARNLVNAAGAWADQIALLAGVKPIGLTPLRRSMARVPAPDGADVSKWPMIFGPGEAWYAKPDAGALIISPADEGPCDPHDAWPDDLTLAEGIDRFQAYTTYEVTRLLSSWAGLRTFAPDRSLVLGPDPSDHSFIWCAGQGGYGFQTSPAASQLIASLVNGNRPDIDLKTVLQLSPARFA